MRPRRFWTEAEVAELRERYPHERTTVLAEHFGRPLNQVLAKAHDIGITKSLEYRREAARRSHLPDAGKSTRFKPGSAPANKGVRHPRGWAPGRMAETQFKPGHGGGIRWDPEIYCVGALRITSDGELQIKVAPGARQWVQMRRYAWWSETGHWPERDQIVIVINGDSHDCRFENLDLISQAENMARNTIHNMPEELKNAVIALGALRRTITYKERRRGQTLDR